MLAGLLLVLIVLWFLGYIRVGGINVPDVALFTVNGQSITLWSLLILLVVFAIIGALPGPFRAIAGVLLILWILSVLGILAFSGLSSILVIAIIVGLALYLLSGAGI